MTTPEPNKTTDIDIKILEGQKVTLLLVNTMGFPVCRHITVQNADIVSAKRYQGHMTDKKCLQLKYVEKGKRKPIATRYSEADLAIASGWQEIEVPNNFVAFGDGLLSAMTAQAKIIIYTQQNL